MSNCPNLATCAFFKQYESVEEKKFALLGFVNKYCKGDKQSECVRRKISNILGDPAKVPVNMMPNGLPLSGTSKENWSAEVKALL